MGDIRKPVRKKDFEHFDTVILDGIVDWVEYPIDDSVDSYIGVKTMRAIPTFSGELFETVTETAFTPSFEEKIGWRDSAANIRFVFSKDRIDPHTVEENSVKALFGMLDYEFTPIFSSFTGYLYTDEQFKVGGHDLLAVLKSHVGEWVHMEIELFRKRR